MAANLGKMLRFFLSKHSLDAGMDQENALLLAMLVGRFVAARLFTLEV